MGKQSVREDASVGRAQDRSTAHANLRRPAVGDHYLRRPRLLDLCDDVTEVPLTLVVAPAGTGKTWLVSGWAADSSTPTAWLSLDEVDRDGVSFWLQVITALETLAPACGDRALETLLGSHDQADVVDQLLAALEGVDREAAVLVIDDFHLVDGDDFVIESVARFVQGQPRWLRVVLVSRRVPGLPIGRMRARGQLAEIHFDELRFSPDEAADLMGRLSPGMSEAGIQAAVDNAGGWATSLMLAALAARSQRARPEASAPEHGDELLMQHFVLHEVLADEAPEVVDILRAAAVVPRINAALAHAITGRADAGEILQTAEARGLFVTRRCSGWFDLHESVREVLVADLANRSPSRLIDLHRAAAQWFEAADDVPTALDQWLLADRPRDALRLLAASHGALYDSGHEAVVARVIAAIPTAVAVGELDAMVDYAWCHMLVDRRRFVELVEGVAWWAERSSTTDTVRARVDLLSSAAAVASGRWVDGAALSRQVMRAFGGSGWQDPYGRFAPNLIARDVALSERWDDSSDEVREAELALSRDAERRLAFEGTRAMGEALAGRPLDALRVSAGTRRAADVAEMSILRTELALAEAVARRELGDRPRALDELANLAGGPADLMVFCRVFAMCELAEAHLDSAELDQGWQAYRRAETIVEAESLGADVKNRLCRVAVLLALGSQDVEAARRWASEIDDPFWAGVSTARVDLAEGNRAAALASLDQVEPRCIRHEVVLALLRSRAISDREEALKCVAGAIDLACAVGLLQTVASEGAEVIERVEQAAWRAPPEWLDRLRRSPNVAWTAGVTAFPALVEPLTERERDVLRFLPSRLTVREISDELFLSANTVKFHLRVIYRKLGVSSRAEAAEFARRMTNVRR